MTERGMIGSRVVNSEIRRVSSAPQKLWFPTTSPLIGHRLGRPAVTNVEAQADWPVYADVEMRIKGVAPVGECTTGVVRVAHGQPRVRLARCTENPAF